MSQPTSSFEMNSLSTKTTPTISDFILGQDVAATNLLKKFPAPLFLFGGTMTGNIDMGANDIRDVDIISFDNLLEYTITKIGTDLVFDVPGIGDTHKLGIMGTIRYSFGVPAADWNGNNIINLGTLNTNTIPAGPDTFAMLTTTQTLTSKTLTTPTIGDFTNATHDHEDTAGGGNLNSIAITDFDTSVSANSAVTANTAKVTNATHTGDATGATVLTISNDSVTYSKMQNVVANNVFLGNNSGVDSIVEELTGTEATAMLNLFTSTLQGLTPLSGGGTTNFLRADGTWDVPAGIGITSINANTTAAQVIAGSLNRITVNSVTGTTTLDIDAAYVGQASITTLGTITTGVWNGTAITGANINAASTDLTDSASIARSTDNLSFFANTTSQNLADIMTDATGTNALVFAESPTLVTPALGTPSALVLTNATDLPFSGLADGIDGQLITWDSNGVVATVDVGTSGNVLTSNGLGLPPTFQSTGNVVGPGSATDNAIARFDTGTGELIQNSVMSITDAGVLFLDAAQTHSISTNSGATIIDVPADGQFHIFADSVQEYEFGVFEADFFDNAILNAQSVDSQTYSFFDGSTQSEAVSQTGFQWNIELSLFLQSFGVGAQDTALRGVFFKPDGLKMFFVGVTGVATPGIHVYEYALTTAWD